jgi:hypothetical protein
VFHGVSVEDFRAHYWPLCRKIDADNRVGKLVFWVSSLVQHARFARRGVLHMLKTEQMQAQAPRRMSSVLWDLFSGSAPYTDVFQRTLQPGYVGSLIHHLIAGNLPHKGGIDVQRPGERERDH